MSDLMMESAVSRAVSESIVGTHHANHEQAVDLENQIFIDVREQYIADEAEINSGYCNGRENTQHGVNAEHITIAEFNKNEIRLAALEGREPVLMYKSSDVNGPHDMIRGNELYQSKYCADPNTTLEHCMKHANKYPDDYVGNPDAYYVIPKDQYNDAIIIKNGGTPEGWSQTRVENFKVKIQKAEEVIGGPFEERFKPGGCTYDESSHSHNPVGNKERREDIENQHEKESAEIEERFAPDIKDSLMTGAKAAGVAAVLSAITHVIREWKNGKNIFVGDFSEEDYHHLLKNTAKSAAWAGGIATLTDYIGRCFKEASPIVNTTVQVGTMSISHVESYFNGSVTGEEAIVGFTDAALTVGGTQVMKHCIQQSLSSVLAMGPELLAGCPQVVIAVAASIIACELYSYADRFINREVREAIAACDRFAAEVAQNIQVKVKATIEECNRAIAAIDSVDNDALHINQKLEALDSLSEHYEGYRVRTTFDREHTLGLLFGNK